MSRRFFTMAGILAICLATPCLAQQTGTPRLAEKWRPSAADLGLFNVAHELTKIETRFLRYGLEFRDYANAIDPAEIDRLLLLQNEAFRACDLLDAVAIALLGYVHISEVSARADFRTLIDKRLADSIKRLNMAVSAVNHSSNTKSAAIAASAAHMGDDLREAKTLLESIRLPQTQ